MPSVLERARRAWLALRLAAVLLLASVPFWESLAQWALERLPYPHGAVKWALETWHLVLLREGALLAAGVAALLAAVLLAIVPPRRTWLVGVGLAILCPVLLPGEAIFAAFVVAVLLVLNTAPTTAWSRVRPLLRGLGWLPGSWLLLPVPLTLDLLGPGRQSTERYLLALAPLLLVPHWFGLDLQIGRDSYGAQLLAWSQERVDPRVQLLDRAAPGVRGEYHDLEIFGEHAVVVAEDTCRLLAFPLGGGPAAVYSLASRWPPFNAGALDAWVEPYGDPRGTPGAGRAWVITYPGRISAMSVVGGAWREVEHREIEGPCNFMYLRPALDVQRLFLVSVNAHDREPGSLVIFELPGMEPLGRVPLTREDGSWFPTPRDAVWVPPLGRLLLAPNFGDRLYLADPETGAVRPWLELYSANAKPIWVPELSRLLVAMPSGDSIAVVEPIEGVVERSIPTQRGVRALAVDVERGLLVTGSVLTGAVVVQRLEDGVEVDRFGTLMPMIREIELIPASGEALVATWTALYRLPYAP